MTGAVGWPAALGGTVGVPLAAGVGVVDAAGEGFTGAVSVGVPCRGVVVAPPPRADWVPTSEIQGAPETAVSREGAS